MKKSEIYIFVFTVIIIASIILVSSVNLDLNHDGVVNITDLQILAAHFEGKAAYNSSYDFNNDFKVDLFDIVSVAREVNISTTTFASFINKTPNIISWPLTIAYPGIQYDIRLGVVGGYYPYKFSLEQAPSGMSIDSTTGEIKWTPATNLEGNKYNVKIKVLDSQGQAVYQSYTLSVTKNDFYFVATNGSDSTGDGSIGNPWKTMNYSIKQGNLSDVLYVRGGTYVGKIKVNSGNINKWIAYPGEHPVLDMNLSTISPRDSYGLVDGLEIINSQHWGFSFDSGSGISGWIFRRNNMHNLYDNTASENPSFIFFWDEGSNFPYFTDFVIQDNTFHNLYDRGSGVNGDVSANYHGGSTILYDTGDFLIENNTIYNIDGGGINDKDDGTNNTIRGNTVWNWHRYCGIEDMAQGTSTGDEISYNKIISINDSSNDMSICGISIGFQPGNITNIDVNHNTIIGFVKYASTPYGNNNSIRFYDNIIYEEYSLDVGGYHYPYGISIANVSNLSGYIGPIAYRDYNIIYTSQSYVAGIPWTGKFNQAGWQQIGFDTHSYFVNPELTDTYVTVKEVNLTLMNRTSSGWVQVNMPYNEPDISALNLTPLASSAACGTAKGGVDIGAIKCA